MSLIKLKLLMNIFTKVSESFSDYFSCWRYRWSKDFLCGGSVWKASTKDDPSFKGRQSPWWHPHKSKASFYWRLIQDLLIILQRANEVRNESILMDECKKVRVSIRRRISYEDSDDGIEEANERYKRLRIDDLMVTAMDSSIDHSSDWVEQL